MKYGENMGWMESMVVVVGLYAGSGDVCCPVYNYNHNNHE